LLGWLPVRFAGGKAKAILAQDESLALAFLNVCSQGCRATDAKKRETRFQRKNARDDVRSWCDNEWGCSCRVCDTAVAIGKLQ
jgi:hypothetical protein